MEAVFKLTRAEVEEACVHYLAQRGVHFSSTPTLVGDDPKQSFDTLYFKAEIALAPPAPRLVPTQSPLMRDLMSPDIRFTADLSAAEAAAESHSVTGGDLPPVRVREAAAMPLIAPPSTAAGSKSGFAVLDPSVPPSTSLLPQSVLDYRARSQ